MEVAVPDLEGAAHHNVFNLLNEIDQPPFRKKNSHSKTLSQFHNRKKTSNLDGINYEPKFLFGVIF